jgi:hypothetical protein
MNTINSVVFFHGVGCSDCDVPSHESVKCCRPLSTLQRNVLCRSSGLKSVCLGICLCRQVTGMVVKPEERG